MKRSEIFFGLLKIPLDFLAVLAGLLVAYKLREANIDLLPRVQLLASGPQLPELSYYVSHFAVPWALLYLIVLASLKLYALKVTLGAWHEVGRIVLASLLWLALIVAWFFLVQKQLFFSRAVLIHGVVLVSLLVIIARATILLVQRACLRRGFGVRSVYSFGSQHLPESVRRILARDHRFHYLGHLPSIHSLVHHERGHPIDLILHTDPHPSSEETVHLIHYCRSHHIGYAFLPPVFADVPHQLAIAHIGMVPLLHFVPTPLDGWGRVIKRMLDLAASIALLILLSPILLLVALLIFLTGGRPIVYVSHRVGQHRGQLIPILKFRTMQPDADHLKEHLKTLSHRADGPLFKIRNDPRVTPLGRFLRRWSLDELPQLFNVLLGHLSLVGPRPHLQEEVALYDTDQLRVFAVKPGITGLSQVSGRSDLKFDEEVKLDIRYIEEWSVLLDLWILWRTFVVVLEGGGAD